MKVQEAVAKAKKYVREVYADEKIRFVGLEEVEWNDDAWRITIGFSRPWDVPPKNVMAEATKPPLMRYPPPRPPEPRTYKIVVVRDSDGEVLAIKHRNPVSS